VLLLQTSHKTRISPSIVQDTLTQLATTTDPQRAEVFLEKFVQEVSKGNATIDDTTKEVLKGVKKTFEDTSEVAISDAHDNDLTLLSSIASGTVEDCTSQHENTKQENVQAGISVSNQESSHQTCRAELAALEVEQAQKCGAFETFRQSLSPPSCTVPGSTDGLVDFLSAGQMFFTANLQQAQALEAACKDAVARVDTKKEQCNNLQLKFEMAFCVWRADAHESCYSYNSCHEEAAKTLDLAGKNAEANAASRKLEWTALQKIECYIDVLISDAETEERQEAMDACKSLAPDTSRFDIVVPELGAPDDCDLSAVAEFPCTGGFVSKYDGMSGLQSCTSCPDLEPHLQLLSPTEAVRKGGHSCIRIITGTEEHNHGKLEVKVDKGSGPKLVASGKFEQGDTVWEQCYARVEKIQVRGPCKDAWTGSIELSDDEGAVYYPMTCLNCDGDSASTSSIVVDGDDDSTGQAPTRCHNGDWCTLVEPCRDADCSGHGTTSDGDRTDGCECTCANGFSGSDCSTPPACNAAQDCSAHGSTDDTDSTDGCDCACEESFTGDDCSIPPECSSQSHCNGHATLDKDATDGCVCQCAGGWSGDDCSTPPVTEITATFSHCPTQTQSITNGDSSASLACKVNEFSCGGGTHASDHGECQVRMNNGEYEVRACFVDRCWLKDAWKCDEWGKTSSVDLWMAVSCAATAR
jgi:hypothetical protein